MAAVDDANLAVPARGDDLKRINIGGMSQSELLALSSSFSSSFDMRRGEDDAIPQLDRSVFNESAGGRRQTYSRLHHRSCSRLPGLHPSFKSHRQAHRASDPVSHSIVHYLKHFLNGDDNPPPPPPLPPQPPHLDPDSSRGNSENHRGIGVELQEVNGKGEKVDLIELGKNGDGRFAEELKRRTEGLESEEGALGFLSGLDGQWCSRRKKRKYIDAAVIGDSLPVGWKLLLGLRRRDYRVTVYCRRFISPTGQQFMSCKEAAAYLKSQFRGRAIDDTKAHISSSLEKNDDEGIGNLPEVQVKAAFECSKCKSTFHDRDVYTQHLLSSHQKTAKRYRFGRPVGEGVIIKDDGKFECQFCHKVFNEKRSYSGHVGIHVRNSGKNSVEHPNKSNAESMPSKMDALIEIAQNSVAEENHPVEAVKFDEIDPIEEDAAAAKVGSDSVEGNKAMIEDLNQCTEVIMETNDVVRNDFEWHNVEMDDSVVQSQSREVEKFGNVGDDLIENTQSLTVEDIDYQAEGCSSSVPLVQSFQFFPPFSSSNKGQDEFSVVDHQKLDNVTGFEELRFDDIEPYSFGHGQDLTSLAGSSMNLGDETTGMELGFNTSVRFGSDTLMLNAVSADHRVTVCVWCRSEFSLDGIESEAPSDSIGYMCPACKAKISGHFGGRLSMDLHDF